MQSTVTTRGGLRHKKRLVRATWALKRVTILGQTRIEGSLENRMETGTGSEVSINQTTAEARQKLVKQGKP